MTEAHRILKDDGSMYIVSGWANLSSLYKTIEKIRTYRNKSHYMEIFGVNTKKIRHHTIIFFIYLRSKAKRVFNTNCGLLNWIRI